jgi:hypothetical protein
MVRRGVGLAEVTREHVPALLAEQVLVERRAPIDLARQRLAEPVVEVARVRVELVDLVEPHRPEACRDLAPRALWPDERAVGLERHR